MRRIALDTRGPVLGIAAARGDEILRFRELPPGFRHIENLTPALEELLCELEWTAPSLDALVVAAGPGSFTGLRVGMAAAKGLSLASGAPLVSVDSLEALATSEALADPSFRGLVVPVIDARKARLYGAIFEQQGPGVLRRVLDNSDLPAPDLARTVAARDPETWKLTGALAPETLAGDLSPELLARQRPARHPRGASALPGLVRCGAARLREGLIDDPYAGPAYLRAGDVGEAKNYPRFSG